MKKRFGMLILFMMFFLPINVLAEEYQKMSLIPVDTVATVKKRTKIDQNSELLKCFTPIWGQRGRKK